MPDYDAIVVGAGLAGGTAALCMARAGLSVLLLERGDTAGAKNVSGGRLYGHSLERILPGFAAEAPIERTVVRERISLMSPKSCATLDFSSPKLAEGGASYTVLRAEFDAWLAAKAEEAGCDVVCPAHVDALLYDGNEMNGTGRVIGVRAGEDELTADVVLLADGVNGLLAQSAGLKKELSPRQVAVGVKQIMELPAQSINDRFNLEDGQGCAHLFAGTPSNGLTGGGFLYTNKDSLSLGLVITVDDLARSTVRLPNMPNMPDMMEAFRNSAPLRPLLAGARLAEYSAHLVPEGGLNMLPELCADGLLVLGDAAGLCLNLGYTVRGMDYAVASGELAAQCVAEAKAAGDFSKACLNGYKRRLEESFVLQDMKTHKNAPAFMESTPHLFSTYPQMAENALLDLFRVNGPSRIVRKKLLPHARKAGLFRLLRDAWRASGSL